MGDGLLNALQMLDRLPKWDAKKLSAFGHNFHVLLILRATL
jgi:hypothetical protein